MPRREDSTSVGPWFRCWCDILLDPKLRSLARSDRWLYLEMQALAKLSVDFTRDDGEVGLLLSGVGQPMTEAQIARALDLRPARFRGFLRRLEGAIPGAIIRAEIPDFGTNARRLDAGCAPAARRLDAGCAPVRLTNYPKRQYAWDTDMPHAKRLRQRLAHSNGKSHSSEGPSERQPPPAHPTRIQRASRARNQSQSQTTTSVAKATAEPAVRGRKLTAEENDLKDGLFEHWVSCTREYFKKPDGKCPRFARGHAANLFANLARDGHPLNECRLAIDIFFRRRFRFREREREKAEQGGVDPPAVPVNVGHFENQSEDLLSQARHILERRRDAAAKEADHE